MEWLALLSASIFEVLWASSLKFLDFKKIKTSYREFGFNSKGFAIQIIPLLGYIFFGIANVSLLAYACKYLPLTICFAIWMGLALVLQTMIDKFYFKENFNRKQMLFLGILLIGILGLKMSFKQ